MVGRRRVGAGAALGLGALLLTTAGSGVASAQGSPPVDDVMGNAHERARNVVEALEVPAADRIAATEYWTPRRMVQARPPVPHVAENAQARIRDVFSGAHSGTPRTVSSAAPSPLVVAAGSQSSLGDPSSVPHVGKVFFSTPSGDKVCSANLVASENRSTVATAGHCLHDGAGGGFAERFVFAPAYDGGESEHGVWAATELVASQQWVQSSDLEHDYAFAVFEEKNGRTVQDEVGASSSITFNEPRGLDYIAYGYPATAPYDGQTLRRCEGAASDDPAGRSTQGIDCDMTGGASGGPWFLSGGEQNSVNSYKYDADPDSMYGPYFGDGAEQLYDHASSK